MDVIIKLWRNLWTDNWLHVHNSFLGPIQGLRIVRWHWKTFLTVIMEKWVQEKTYIAMLLHFDILHKKAKHWNIIVLPIYLFYVTLSTSLRELVKMLVFFHVSIVCDWENSRWVGHLFICDIYDSYSNEIMSYQVRQHFRCWGNLEIRHDSWMSPRWHFLCLRSAVRRTGPSPRPRGVNPDYHQAGSHRQRWTP